MGQPVSRYVEYVVHATACRHHGVLYSPLDMLDPHGTATLETRMDSRCTTANLSIALAIMWHRIVDKYK